MGLVPTSFQGHRVTRPGPLAAGPLAAFLYAASPVGNNGGMRWVLLDDLGKPGHFRESFLVESWSEHLRQVERSTIDDEAVERYARSFLHDGAVPSVRHFLVTHSARI